MARIDSSGPDTLALAGKRVLIVDDDSDARELLRVFLESVQMTVCDAENVDDALDMLDHDSFNLIVSDIGMPGRDGYFFIRAVRVRSDGVSIPAVALTSFERPEDRARALRAGFNVHLGKPFQPATLIPFVAKLLRG